MDVSWRIRLKGYKAIYRPTAVVFHDKRFSSKGLYIPTKAEIYYSLEARLLMAWKWSFPRLLDGLKEIYKKTEGEEYRLALESFEKRMRENRLPVRIDPKHKVGDITSTANGEFQDYGPVRY